MLATWIAALLVAGAAAAVADAPREEPPLAVTTESGDDPLRRRDSDDRPDVTTTTATSTSSTANAPSTSARRRSSTATTSAPKASPLAVQTARVDQPGVWVVRRDGTGLRRVEANCTADHRVWLSEDQLAVVRDGESTPFRLRLDGSTSSFPQLEVTDPQTGQTIPLRGMGSLSPDRRMMAMSYGGAAYGVALVDLTTGDATSILQGDNPLPTWSPHGEILIVGPDAATLVGTGGTIHRTSPAPIGMDPPWLRWSPDGSRILGRPPADWNRWVVLDPWTGATQAVPHLGPGGNNEVFWGDSDTLVVGDNGVDHQIDPTVRVYDLTTGRERVIAEAARRPKASAASGLVAFEDSRTHRTIALVRVDGSGRSDLVTVADGLYTSAHSFSPSGDQLLFDVCARRTSSGGLPST